MTRKITPAQLDEIEAAAKEATPGPWEVIGGGEYVTPIGLPAGFDDCGVSPRDVHYIAAFDPPTVLALIAEVRELRAKVERVRLLHEPSGDPEVDSLSTCDTCSDLDGKSPRWPCATIKALGGEA